MHNLCCLCVHFEPFRTKTICVRMIVRLFVLRLQGTYTQVCCAPDNTNLTITAQGIFRGHLELRGAYYYRLRQAQQERQRLQIHHQKS